LIQVCHESLLWKRDNTGFIAKWRFREAKAPVVNAKLRIRYSFPAPFKAVQATSPVCGGAE
jgi:hypothetical protein